jgi:hypothetical protein
MLQTAEVVLGKRFGERGLALLPAIAELNDAERYDDLLWAMCMADRLEEVRRVIAGARVVRNRSRRIEKGKCFGLKDDLVG